MKKDVVSLSFYIGLVLKAINAGFEIILGILLIFFSPERLNYLIDNVSIYAYKLPHRITNYIANAINNYTVDVQSFIVVYSLTHGVFKLVVIILLWKKKLFAYPVSIIMFSLFIVYQMYHYFQSHSIWLILLTVLDIVMIVLTVIEYKKIKTKPSKV